MHLRDLAWFQQADSETFFPRCYRLSHNDDKQAFIGKKWSTFTASLEFLLDSQERFSQFFIFFEVLLKNLFASYLLCCLRLLNS